jgi:crotonobetainyl-CoA:carnitine CoA-transferase CaiB-like acyl-CoA transferase
MFARTANASELVPLMVQMAADRNVDEFMERAHECGVPASKIVDITELPVQPQVVNNAIFVERDHPVAGRVREPRPAARFSNTPSRVGDPAPMPGQHSDEIVTELGLDASALRAAGIIG